MPGSSGEQRIPARSPALRRRATARRRRAGGARLQDAGQLRVGSGDGQVDDQLIVFGDLFKQVDVPGYQVGFGHDADAQPPAGGEDLEQTAGDFGAALDGLVGVGGGADGDFLAALESAQLLLEQPGGVLLDEDLALEVLGLAELHIFVGVAGVAVAAGELAATIGIDASGEGKTALGDRGVEHGPDGQGAEFHLVAVVDPGGGPGLAGDSGEPGRGREGGILIQDGEEGSLGKSG